MNRRRLLQGAAGLAALLPVSGLMRRANADLPALPHPLLVHTMMLGGPDFRHMFPPAFDSSINSYGYRFYEGRARALGIAANASAFADKWQNGYAHFSAGQTEFGMLAGCDWLGDMWRAGHVAIIANVVGAESRDHEHAQRVWESADRTLSQVSAPPTGWGGRLADLADNQVMSLTNTPRSFCFNRNPDAPLVPGSQRVVTLSDPRSIGLFEPADNADATAKGISRALRQYYAALDSTLPAAAPQRELLGHEQLLQTLGDKLRPQFDALTLPAEISALLSGPTALATRPLAAQFRNLYYALSATADLDYHTASLAFGNWDSHDIQQAEVEPKYRDLFSSTGALANLYRTLPSSVSGQMVFMFSGEFGRQLRGNGDNGTDHGRGNSVLLVGYPVRGGVYGELFPTDELERFDEASTDINGRTHLESVLSPLLEYLKPGSADIVLPNRGTALTEAGVDLSRLIG